MVKLTSFQYSAVWSTLLHYTWLTEEWQKNEMSLNRWLGHLPMLKTNEFWNHIASEMFIYNKMNTTPVRGVCYV